MALADRLKAPVVHPSRAKDFIQYDNYIDYFILYFSDSVRLSLLDVAGFRRFAGSFSIAADLSRRPGLFRRS